MNFPSRRVIYAAVALCIFLSSMAAVGQLKPIPHSEAEMEREDDAPALSWGRGFSPGRRSVFGGFGTVGDRPTQSAFNN